MTYHRKNKNRWQDRVDRPDEREESQALWPCKASLSHFAQYPKVKRPGRRYGVIEGSHALVLSQLPCVGTREQAGK